MQSSTSLMLRETLTPMARECVGGSASNSKCQTSQCLLQHSQSLLVDPDFFALQALRKVPEVNASWNTDYIRQYHNIDVSVAVQTPGGLMVPIVHDADALGLSEISAKVKDLATKVSVPRIFGNGSPVLKGLSGICPA